MNHKTKNTKAVSATSISFLVTVLTIVMMTPAYAHDSNGDIMNFEPFSASSSETIWYDMDALDDVTYDGSENNGVALTLIAEVPRHTIHSTDFDLTVVSSNNPGYNSRLGAAYLGSTNVFGATGSYSGGGGQYKVIWLNTNNSLNYDPDVGCNIIFGEVNPDYVITHEFGHFAGLGHHVWHWGAWDGHTAMKSGCNSDQSQLRTEDLNDINDHYT